MSEPSAREAADAEWVKLAIAWGGNLVLTHRIKEAVEASIAAALEARDAEPKPEPGPRSSDENIADFQVAPTGCAMCKRPYGDHNGFPDLLIPDPVWLQISPTGHDGGLLCPCCIIKHLTDLRLKDVPAWFASGPLKMVSEKEWQAVRSTFGSSDENRADVGDRRTICDGCGRPLRDHCPCGKWCPPQAPSVTRDEDARRLLREARDHLYHDLDKVFEHKSYCYGCKLEAEIDAFLSVTTAPAEAEGEETLRRGKQTRQPWMTEPPDPGDAPAGCSPESEDRNAQVTPNAVSSAAGVATGQGSSLGEGVTGHPGAELGKRACAKCGVEITRAFGFVKAGDILGVFEGEKLDKWPRELCGYCGLKWTWNEAGELVRQPPPEPAAPGPCAICGKATPGFLKFSGGWACLDCARDGKIPAPAAPTDIQKPTVSEPDVLEDLDLMGSGPPEFIFAKVTRELLRLAATEIRRLRQENARLAEREETTAGKAWNAGSKRFEYIVAKAGGGELPRVEPPGFDAWWAARMEGKP